MKHVPKMLSVIVVTATLVLVALPAEAVPASAGPSNAGDDGAGIVVPSRGGAELEVVPRGVTSVEVLDGADVWQLEGGEEVSAATSDGHAAVLTGRIPDSSEASSTLEFDIGLEGSPTSLVLDERGGVSVLDADGATVNRFSAPVATSSSGLTVVAGYEVEGGVLKIVTEAPAGTGAVTVRSSLECNAGFCTGIMTRAETRSVANGDHTAAMAAISVACGPAAGWCGLGMAVISQQARSAVSKGVCVAIRKTHVSPVAWVVHERCRR